MADVLASINGPTGFSVQVELWWHVGGVGGSVSAAKSGSEAC